MKHQMKHQTTTTEPKIINVDQNGKEIHMTFEAHTMEAQVTTTQSVQHKYLPHISPASFVPFIIPALLFLVIVFSITRTIVLARQLIMMIEATAEMNNDVELNQCCQSKEEEKREPTPAQPVAIFSPENVYVMPQTYVMPNGDGAYPGQLMPVYVDKLGQPIY